MRLSLLNVNMAAGWKRLGLLLLAGTALVWALSYVSARVGAMRMVIGGSDADSLIAALAYDPHQAEAHAQLGSYSLFDPFLFDPSQAVHHFEAVVETHPFESAGWSHLGYAYEQRGDLARAQRAYATGIELAPNYFSPRWAYANFALRQAEIEPALGQFRHTAEISPPAIGHICDLIWQSTGEKAETLFQFGANLRPGIARGAVCYWLLRRTEYSSAVRLWETLAEDDEAKMKIGRSLISGLVRANQWSMAHRVWRQVVNSEAQERDAGPPGDLLFWNGDFESDVGGGEFGWTITSNQQVEARLDSVRPYSGERSLRLEFKGRQGISFADVVHPLVVEPSTGYVLRFHYRTEKLRNTNGLYVVLSDAQVPTRFRIQSDQLGNERQWTERAISFVTPLETRVIRLRIMRRPTARLYDYIEGRVWFDGFRLELASAEKE